MVIINKWENINVANRFLQMQGSQDLEAEGGSGASVDLRKAAHSSSGGQRGRDSGGPWWQRIASSWGDLEWSWKPERRGGVGRTFPHLRMGCPSL